MTKKKSRLDLLSLLVRVVVAFVLLFVGIKSYQWLSLNKTFKQLNQEHSLYSEQIIQLNEKIEKADTDFFIEKRAREESELAKPGDFVIKFKSN
ncbi:MAG: septum formation initiator family protein [Caldisericia bacterium]|nr:septum formation initiator family protein [Caldisericia bacterium]